MDLPRSEIHQAKDTPMIKAVIFIPETDFETHAATCLDYCAERGYEVAGIISGNWVAAAAMLRDGAAHILIVACDEHLDPDRRPRIEVVADQAVVAPRPRTSDACPPLRGIDPETIAAARRIARRLNGMR